MTETVLEGEIVKAVVPRIDDALTEFASPLAGIARATVIANALSDIVRKRELSVNIQGREHLKVEAWLTLGALCGVTASTAETRQDENGFAARVEVIRLATGEIIGRAESRCDFSEKLKRKDGSTFDRWNRDEPHACMSMAQTRATSKALAQVLRWIPVLAGYSGTPLEEMPSDTRGGESAGQVARSGSSSGGVRNGSPPRVDTRREPPPPFARTVETPTGARPEWFLTPVGFGKHKEKTWEHMSRGSVDGDRFGYLKYLLSTPAKSDRDKDIQMRARYCLGIIEDTTEKQYAKAEAAPAEPNWDADVPLPEDP